MVNLVNGALFFQGFIERIKILKKTLLRRKAASLEKFGNSKPPQEQSQKLNSSISRDVQSSEVIDFSLNFRVYAIESLISEWWPRDTGDW